ncbi:MAG: hypothetical protein RIB45_17840 [Marivibrio sp.]|uniref:phage major capsid protein n=1 Tax=Marivibrio sp. TaxID=2039719 RepID=UPI0032F09B7E
MRRQLLTATALIGAGVLLAPIDAAPMHFVEAKSNDQAAQIPELGVIGAEAIREAFEGDLYDLGMKVREQLEKKLGLGEDGYLYTRALFGDFIVVEHDGKLMKYGYTLDDDGEVTFGDGEEVVQTFAPAGSEAAAMAEAVKPGDVAGNLFLEATDADSGVFEIRVIRAGLSGNRTFYPDAVLREAAPMFEGVRVFVKSDQEHLSGGGKDVRNLIGAISSPRFVEGASADQGEIQATLKLIEPDGAVGLKLREAWKRGMTSLFGFSIDVLGRGRPRRDASGSFKEAVAFTKINSVDLIVEPGAAGAIIGFKEAQKETVMDRSEIIQALLDAGLITMKEADGLTDEQLKDRFTEALGRTGGGSGGQPPSNPAPNAGPDVENRIRMVEARHAMRERLANSTLPQPARDRLRQQFEGMESFTEAQVDQAIRDELDYLSHFSEAGRVTGAGGGRIQMGETRFEKVEQMLDAFFDPSHRDHRHARSFREAYISITGDTRVTGRLRDCDESLMREALDSQSFGDVLGDAITRRMVADYNVPTRYDVWRQLATVTSVGDFRTQERTRFGGYGDMPKVAEGQPYNALNSPTDEKATYAVEKRGGTESVTLEMIKNDDAGAISRIPIKLSRAAKRTCGKFVLDFLATNPVIYDGLAVFHANHGNLGAAALDKTSYAARRLAMLNQTELSSGEKIGIPPAFMWVPDNLEETAVDLFRRNTEQDKTFIQSQQIQIVPVWYWTDANNWFLTVDPADIPTIEIAFLDGQEEPELFIQDSPNQGSMFSHDTLSWKLRHIYGGNWLDHRGADGSIVA